MKCLLVKDDKYQRLSLKGLLQAHKVVQVRTFHESNLQGLEFEKLPKEKGMYAIITTVHIENALIQKVYQFEFLDNLLKQITESSLELVLRKNYIIPVIEFFSEKHSSKISITEEAKKDCFYE